MNQWVLSLISTISKKRFIGNEFAKDIFATSRLFILFIVAVLIVFSIAEGRVTATGLFQSPQSPPSEPPPGPTATPVSPPTEPPIPTNTPIPEATATPIPVESASTGETTAAEAEVPTVTEEVLTEEVVVEQQAEPTPTETPPPAASESTETQLVEPAPEEASAGPQPAPIRLNSADEAVTEEAEDTGRNLILDQAEFIDTIAVSGAYIWLCCGMGLLLLAPLSLLLIYIRGRNRISQEEMY